MSVVIIIDRVHILRLRMGCSDGTITMENSLAWENWLLDTFLLIIWLDLSLTKVGYLIILIAVVSLIVN